MLPNQQSAGGDKAGHSGERGEKGKKRNNQPGNADRGVSLTPELTVQPGNDLFDPRMLVSSYLLPFTTVILVFCGQLASYLFVLRRKKCINFFPLFNLKHELEIIYSDAFIHS